MKILVRRDTKNELKIWVTKNDMQFTSLFNARSDFTKGARELGVSSALLRELTARFRSDGQPFEYDSNAIPEVDFRVRATTGSEITVTRSLLGALSQAGPDGVVEWDDSRHYCVLDLDFHGDTTGPDCNALNAAAANLRPVPQQYWISRNCGLHAIYMSIDPFTAIELAAVAAYQLQRRFPEARIEFLSRTRGYPANTTPTVCTADASMHGANPILMRHDAVDATQYLEDNEYELGQRYAHTQCPVNPHQRAATNSPPVCVRDSGIHCYICEADGIYRGSQYPGFFPYFALLGTCHETALATCVANFTHWGHARFVMQVTIPDPLHGRHLYAALLKANHGEDDRIQAVFTAGEPYGIIRQQGFWADYSGSILAVDKQSAIIHSLPAAASPVQAEWLVQNIDLTHGGYPPVRPVRGIRLTANQPPAAGNGILCVIPAAVEPSCRPAYVPEHRRTDMELAWQQIEVAFPAVNRALVTLLIIGAGCVEQRAGLPPMLILHGPTGVGKTSHVELAAAIIGESSNIVRFNRDYDRYTNAILNAKQRGRYVLFDEFFKSAKQVGVDPTVAMESLLSFNESTQMYMIYTGAVPLGALPFFIWTDSDIPTEILTHAQIGRRVHICKLHAPLVWTDTLPASGLFSIHSLRQLGRQYAGACDTIVSGIMDRWFTGAPCEFARAAAELGFLRLQDSDAMVERGQLIRDLYAAYNNAPPMIDASDLKRWSKPGYKLCDGVLRECFELLQQHDELGSSQCKRLDDMILQTELGLPTPTTCERSKPHGRKFAIRFIMEVA